MKILIVEDQEELAQNIMAYMDKEGYVCEWVTTYQKAIEKFTAYNYDMLLLDLMLPDGNGLDILRYVKKEGIDSGVLILSAKNALDDRIEGLDLGADDYLPKPFHLSELNARIKAIFRRKNLSGAHEIVFNEIAVNTDTMEVMVNNKSLELTRKEYEMLLYMLVNKNRVLTKQSIAEHLWGDYMDTVDSF
ncbi:response regulator transcription factor [Fulvivirga maritima]|uniref:response regulator transcription factor n=1 Tax=Fulvivirga maritima TaxID=2904247 RepID=UPI002795E15F|nr:response regulator transcription factor [Fulvivirga maritima]